MKILYVVHDFFPHFYGGTERYILNLSKQMQRMGHSVTVLTYGLMEPLESFSADTESLPIKHYFYDGVPVVSIRHKAMPADLGFVIDDRVMERAVERILQKKSFDLMHIAHPMRIASAYRAAKRVCVPVVLTLTDFWLLCPRGRFYKPDYSPCNSPDSGGKCVRECAVDVSILKRYEDAKKLFESVDVLISPSKFLMGVFKANGWRRKIYHVKHGVDYRYVRPYGPGRKHSGKVTFGYMGVVGRFKGVDLLVKAFSEAGSSDVLLKIYGNIVGEPDFSSELRLAAERDERISLMGKYSHDDLPRIMNEIDILVVPSSTLESYGLVVVEGLAYNVPVIASDIVGSAYEYIRHGENGMIFSMHNPSELTDIIRQIAEQPALIGSMRSHISAPPRLEEEAFTVEKIYRTFIRD